MPEMTEEEYRSLKGLQSTVASMLKNPKAGALLEKAHKMVDPKAPTPRLEAEEEREALLAEPRKAMEDIRAELAAEKAARQKASDDARVASLSARHEEGFAKLRKQRWTAEGIDGVKKVMEDHGILDVEIAAAYFEKQHPPQDPISQQRVGGWNLFEAPDGNDEDWKKLLETKGESEPLVDRLAQKALQEHRQAAA